MLTLRPNRAGFERLRTINQALILTDADRRGPVLTVLNRVHVRQVRRMFSSRGGEAGAVWPPWSPAYARWRRLQRGRLGNRMMRLSDTLFESSTNVSHGNYIGLWRGQLRYAFGFRNEAGYVHEHAEGVPRRTLIQKTTAMYGEFARAFRQFYIARLRQVARAIRRR